MEEIAFQARKNKKIDKRSGVSQRMPISAIENVVSNAERRCLRAREKDIVPRIGDIYAALTALTGKFELEYEGELRGAEQVAHELIRAAIAAVFEQYFDHNSLQQLVQYFELGGALKLSEEARSEELLKQLHKIQGLVESTSQLGFKPKDKPGLLVAGCEFVLEGLYAHRKINRSEERGFYAEEPLRPEPEPRQPVPRPRRSYQ